MRSAGAGEMDTLHQCCPTWSSVGPRWRGRRPFLLFITVTFLLTMPIPDAEAAVDMCRSEAQDLYMTSGSLSSPDFPRYTGATYCSCNFSMPKPRDVLLFLVLHLQREPVAGGAGTAGGAGGGCQPTFILGTLRMCPSDSTNKSLTFTVTERNSVTLTLDNPGRLQHKFFVTFSADKPLKLQCRAKPIPPGGVMVPPGQNDGPVSPDPEDKETDSTAIIAAVVVIIIIILLIIAAIISWKCVAGKRKKQEGKAPEDEVDNPGYQHTPKSSIYDLSSGTVPPHHLSFSSMLGLNKDLQPIEAPITGLGSLAAHTEPRHPSMGHYPGVGNGHVPGPQQRADPAGQDSLPPPQPNRPAPPLGDPQRWGPPTGPYDYTGPGDFAPGGAPHGPPGAPEAQENLPPESPPHQRVPGGRPPRPAGPGGPLRPVGPRQQAARKDRPKGTFRPSPPSWPSGQPGPGGPQGPFQPIEVQDIPGGPDDLPTSDVPIIPILRPESDGPVSDGIPTSHVPVIPIVRPGSDGLPTSHVPVIPIVRPQTVPSTMAAPPAHSKPHKYPMHPPGGGTAYHPSKVAPPDKARAFNVSADDLPFMDDTEDEDRPRGGPKPRRPNVSNV